MTYDSPYVSVEEVQEERTEPKGLSEPLEVGAHEAKVATEGILVILDSLLFWSH